MDQTYQEVMVTPLGEFLKEADELGYSFFCKDIVKKVIVISSVKSRHELPLMMQLSKKTKIYLIPKLNLH